MKKLKVTVLIGLIAALIFSVLIFAANRACLNATRGRIFFTSASVPKSDVGLLLGCTQFKPDGQPNLHFDQRINAAVALYRAGKIQHLLVSGDNNRAGHNEPEEMRAALLSGGVPTSAITCDSAGFRTLDSVVRAKEVFGLARCTIITELFHSPRALWIAKVHGLDAVAFAAPDVSRWNWSLRARVREWAARAWCALDLFVLHRDPKVSGPKQALALPANHP